jgi:hypothetical protein
VAALFCPSSAGSARKRPAQLLAMIYVLTVHWKADFWVDAQISRLRKYIREPFRIYAFCDGTRRDHSAKFDYCSPIKGVSDHASKLNELASVVCRAAEDSDILIFCDSDAFPIQDITAYIGSGLSRCVFPISSTSSGIPGRFLSCTDGVPTYPSPPKSTPTLSFDSAVGLTRVAAIIALMPVWQRYCRIRQPTSRRWQ